MFIRHIVTLILCAFSIGCSSSHIAPMTDAGTPPATGDAGSVVTHDAAPAPGRDSGVYEWPDSGPVIPGVDAGIMPVVDAGSTEDAGPVIATALRIVFDGPADHSELRGSQDVVMFRFRLEAYEDLEIRSVPYTLEGLTASDRVRGTLGTEYFRDHKIKNFDTGMTIMGPRSLPALPDGSSVSGPILFTDSFAMTAGETRDLIITMDLSNAEDAFGEFFGDGNNRYRVTVGDDSGHFFPISAVRRIATGEFVRPEEIENNVRIPGNLITIVDASLAINMAATPSLALAVSHEPLIPSVGLVFTASAVSDILVRSVRLTGHGDSTGAFAPADLNDVIVMCALFDGATQVGPAQSPDPVTGSMRITSVNVTVPAGSSLTLTARCTADSVVLRDIGDRFAIGIARASDVEAERSDGSAVTTTLATAVSGNASADPANYVTVMRHGEVAVETNNLRQSTILVAGPDFWQNMAQFRVTALYEDIEMSRVRVSSLGESASFNMIAVASDGVVLGSDILPSGTDQERDVVLTSPLIIRRGTSRTFQLWAKLSNVVSSASVGGATTGVARSGNRLSLGLAADVESGDWDSTYAGMLNLRFSGLSSGGRMMADGPELFGNEFVVRRTMPTITRQSLSTTTLANGLDADLYRFQISANSAGSVAVMGFRFRMSMRGSGTVSSLRIRRGSTDVALADATVTFTGTPTDGYVTVVFADEQIVTGSGNVYTLHGVTNGFVAGDALATAFYRDVTANIQTGYVSPGLMLETASGSMLTGILWSEMSEIPHSYATRSLGGSFDWTNDVYIEDMTQTQILTR